MEIIIGEDNVRLGGTSGLITGEIYFKISNHYFPEFKWNDFFVTILGWWVNSFINAINSNANKLEFYFMDGPFYAEAILKENKIYQICFLERNESNSKLIMTTNVCQKELQSMLIKACRKAFQALSLAEVPSYNVDGLKILFEELKSYNLK